MVAIDEKETALRHDPDMDACCGLASNLSRREPVSMVKLFEPLLLRDVVLKNRIMVSPMSMYSSTEGFADYCHLVHLGRFALGGAGTVMMEATAVTRNGRGTAGCNGIWRDEQMSGLRRVTRFLRKLGSASGIQLGHSGPKGSSQRPWHGNGPLTDKDRAERQESPWSVVSSTDAPFDTRWAVPAALSEADIDALVIDYRRSEEHTSELQSLMRISYAVF